MAKITLTLDEEVLGDLLAQIDWRQHPELARRLRSGLLAPVRWLKLTGGMKTAITRRYAKGKGERVADLAAEYRVSRGTIYKVLAEKNGTRSYVRRPRFEQPGLHP